jgi:predicted nucleic acid-binding protein
MCIRRAALRAMTFVDTGILVGALLERHPEHGACREALEQSEAPFTDAHALAETFARLSGFYKVPDPPRRN